MILKRVSCSSVVVVTMSPQFLVIFLSVKTTSCIIAARQVVEFSAQSVAVSITGNGRHVEGVLELLREYELAR